MKKVKKSKKKSKIDVFGTPRGGTGLFQKRGHFGVFFDVFEPFTEGNLANRTRRWRGRKSPKFCHFLVIFWYFLWNIFFSWIFGNLKLFLCYLSNNFINYYYSIVAVVSLNFPRNVIFCDPIFWVILGSFGYS